MRRVLIILFTFVFSLGCEGPRGAASSEAETDSCRQVVAAMDIGSATTKMQVSLVDVCRATVVRRLERDARPVPLGEDVARLGRVSSATRELARAALGELLTKARAHHPDLELAVTTEALRRAKNGDAMVRGLSAATGLDIRRITQSEEAALAFWAAVEVRGVTPERTVVWDVGGESMQMTSVIDGEVRTHGLDFASGDMRRFLTREVQKRDARSPNPVSESDADAALSHVRETVLATQPAWLERQLERADVIGVGALRYYSDVGSSPASCSQQGLVRALHASLDRTDEEIGGPYAHARVPDLLLFLAVLDAFGKPSIAIADLDLTDGLILAPFRAQVGALVAR